MELLGFDQVLNMGARLRREQKANSASLGGCLLQAASDAPLNSLLNHLPHNYS